LIAEGALPEFNNSLLPVSLPGLVEQHASLSQGSGACLCFMNIREIRFEGGPLHGEIYSLRHPFSPYYTVPMINRRNLFMAPSEIDLSTPTPVDKGRYELKAVREIESGRPIEEYYAFVEAPSWYHEAKLREGKENRALGKF
jgi:hypothetical protein